MEWKKKCEAFFALFFTLMMTTVYAQAPEANPQGADNSWTSEQFALLDYESYEDGYHYAHVEVAFNKKPTATKANITLYIWTDVFDPVTWTEVELYYFSWATDVDLDFQIDKSKMSQAHLEVSMPFTCEITYYDPEYVTIEEPCNINIDMAWTGIGDIMNTTERTRQSNTNTRDQELWRSANVTGSIVIQEHPEFGNMIPDIMSGYLGSSDEHVLTINK